MELIVKNKKGKVTHILGVEAEVMFGLLLLGAGALGVLWVYLDPIFEWLQNLVG